MDEDIKAIILIDDVSKDIIKTSLSDIGSKGFKFINTLEELNDDFIGNCANLVILEGFALQETGFSDLQLYKSIYDLNIVFLGSKRYFSLYSTIATCYEVNLAVITQNEILAALYSDISIEEKDAINYFDELNNAKAILQNKQSYPKEVQKVAKSLVALTTEVQIYHEKVDELTRKNNELSQINEKIYKDRERLQNGYVQIIDDINKMNKSMQRYEEIFTKDIYDKVRLHDYANRPLVLYFKEYEDFINLDGLLETLYNTFRVQLRKSVKVIRLFDSSTSRKLLMIPQYYKVLQNSYSLNDIYGNDFIAKSGEYRRVLERILTNDANVDILLVVDSKNFDDIVLTGVSWQFNLCRESAHRDALQLGVSNTLVNDGDSESDMFWGNYDTEKLDSDERFIYLSSRPSIQNIVNLSKMFKERI